MTGKKKTTDQPADTGNTDPPNWKADFEKLQAFLVSIGYGHRAIKRILEGK